MKQTVNFYDFERAFRDHDRFDQFGYDALRALFDYFEELENDTGTEMMLDVIAICCDWTRYDFAIDAWRGFMAEESEGDDFDAKEMNALAWLQDQTSVIVFEGGILVQEF